MLRSFVLLCALALPTAASAASPSGGNFGLGLGGGLGVSGLSGKYYLGDSAAIQGVVGWWGAGQTYGGLGVGADYLFERPEFAGGDPVTLGWNFGFGASAVAWDGGGVGDGALWLGASGVLGLEFLFQPVPIDLVLEYRPGVSLIPGFGVDLINGSGHIRWYF